MKVLILSIYYNRPKLLKKAMESLLASHEHHQDWVMAFGDDNSPIPGEPIVREVLGEELSQRVTFVNTNMSFDEKIEQGITIGKHANRVIAESDADIAITLCDDDELVPTYMRDVCAWFEENPDAMWGYSHLAIFNPIYQKSSDIDLTNLRECQYNFSIEPTSPVGTMDSSQVAFRLKAFEEGVRYPETSKTADSNMPWLINPDAGLFEEMYKKYGDAPFTGLVSQYKGIHDHQLVWHKKQPANGLKAYVKEIHELGGDIL